MEPKYLRDVFAILNELRAQGVLGDYAIGGAMAALFYTEAVRTYDVDVFALIPMRGPLISLSPIYEWCRERGFEAQSEHIMIHGVPVQFLAAGTPLQQEAVEQARSLDYKEVPVRVMPPEHLALLAVQAGGSKRRERARMLLESGALDAGRLQLLLDRHQLRLKWQRDIGDLDE